MASASSNDEVQSGTGSRAECVARTRRPELVSLAWAGCLLLSFEQSKEHFLEGEARNSREVVPLIVIFHAVGEEASGIGQNLSTRESCPTDAPSPSRCRDMRHLDFQMSSPANPSLPVELVPATYLFDGRWLEARDSVTADLGSPPVRLGGNPRPVCATNPGVPRSGKSLGLYAHTVCLVRGER